MNFDVYSMMTERVRLLIRNLSVQNLISYKKCLIQFCLEITDCKNKPNLSDIFEEFVHFSHQWIE